MARFFRKGLVANAPPRPPKPVRPPAPDHKRKIVMGVRISATGKREHRTMSSRKAAWVLAGQKGGLTSAASGKSHRWNSETARKAAIKSWTKRRKFNKRIGARVGMVAKKRTGLWREPLRAYYAQHPTRGITWIPQVWFSADTPTNSGYWARVNADGGERRLSERQALTALGHLKSSKGYIPDTITPVPRRRGTKA